MSFGLVLSAKGEKGKLSSSVLGGDFKKFFKTHYLEKVFQILPATLLLPNALVSCLFSFGQIEIRVLSLFLLCSASTC